MGIALQVIGLIVTQYHEGSGLTYPLPTYFVLLLQTAVSAVAGVLNQFLCKNQNASLHAQNMVLYGFGTLINGIVHITITFLNPHEPGFFQGYDQVGAVLVIASNVLLGLAITAVYKCELSESQISVILTESGQTPTPWSNALRLLSPLPYCSISPHSYSM